MHSRAGLILVPVFCLGLLLGIPAVYAQAIPKALIRLCLRNVISGIACYVVGRGGELIVDGTLSAAWAKAVGTVAGEEPKADAKDKEPPHAAPVPAPHPPLTNPVVEPIRPSDLGSLSKRLAKQRKLAPSDRLSEGFFVYEAPDSLLPKPAQLQSGSAAQRVIREAPKAKAPALQARPTPPQPSFKATDPFFIPEAHQPRLSDPKRLEPPPLPDAYRARDFAKPGVANGLVNPQAKFAGQLSQLSKAQLDCQRTRERLYGLSLIQIFGSPDFDAKFRKRTELVVAPCASQ